MTLSRKIRLQVFLLISTILCTCGVLCKSLGTQTGSRRSKTESVNEMAEREESGLTKEQILAIANRAAREYGRNPDECLIGYDKGNVFWKKAARGPWSDLTDHDFQAVGYDYRAPRPSGTLWVLVDRNTGKVLSVMAQP